MRQGRAEAGHEHLPLTTPDGGRAVAREGRAAITVYVENGGDFSVSFDAVRGAHDGKVVLAPGRIDRRLLDLVRHAHDREEPGS